MSNIDEKLERLDQAIGNGAPPAELRGYIMDIRDHLTAQRGQDPKPENEILRAGLSEAMKQIESLKAQLQTAQLASGRAAKPPGAVHDNLEEIQQKMLLLLMDEDGLTGEEISWYLGMAEQQVNLHVALLQKATFLRSMSDRGTQAKWHLDDAGRTYLMERGLLKKE